MQRWIIPASVAAIVISLAALAILGASGPTAPEDAAQQDPGQIEEPEAREPEPAPQPDESPDQQSEADPESPAPGGETSEDPEDPVDEDPVDQPVAGEQTTQEEETPQSAIQPGPRTATIEITGDSAYYCSVGVIGDPRTVEGRRPTTYEVEVATGGTALETVMAACQKISPGGTMGVNILYDDEVVAQEETSDRLGTVSLSWSPLEE